MSNNSSLNVQGWFADEVGDEEERKKRL